MKSQQVKHSGEYVERERERKRAADYRIVRLSVEQKWKWCGLEMAVSENGYLSIFSNANH